ncbi:MAG TPA: DUF72 domain-containing protein [Tepidisphaeraceae bacterium]|nr:DUF72 domain-containing protein [Tepidisphaeraceae bacterium]
MAQTRIGISGWTYGPWRGTFYPKQLPQSRELQFASRQFNSIEINGSFYSLQRPSSYQTWNKQTPDGFVFSVKGGRFITHMKKLKDVRVPLANFLASGILALKEKLGPILWQFPPGFAFNPERFNDFFELLPRDTEAAAEFAKEHNEKLKGRAYTRSDQKRRMRYAVEIRHPSFMAPEFMQLLRKHNIAFVFADTARRFPYGEDVTADFIYGRLHGDEELYVSGYTDKALDWWASRMRQWRAGKHPCDRRCVLDRPPPSRKSRDVYVYFDNDAKVKAPFDALNLAERLGVKWSTNHLIEPEGIAGEEARAHWPAIHRPVKSAPRKARVLASTHY